MMMVVQGGGDSGRDINANFHQTMPLVPLFYSQFNKTI